MTVNTTKQLENNSLRMIMDLYGTKAAAVQTLLINNNKCNVSFDVFRKIFYIIIYSSI